jgi:hypothetical protein
MKFEAGDETDKALSATLAHEYVLCRESFDRFVRYAEINIMGRRDKIIKIKSYDAYTSFLHHLYEFYVGCIKRSLKNTNDLDSATIDKIMNAEVQRLLNMRVNAIERGDASESENHISYYQIDVHSSFATQFRRIRNRTAHAITKRAVPGTDLSLSQFYKDFHRFIYLLYSAPQWLWLVKDVEAHNWQAIEEFDLAVNAS